MVAPKTVLTDCKRELRIPVSQSVCALLLILEKQADEALAKYLRLRSGASKARFRCIEVRREWPVVVCRVASHARP